MDFYKLNREATFEDLKQFNFPNQKVGVIAHIENENGEILLQQRGIKSHDENGLYEDIGGKVDNSDDNFKSAIIREIREETGTEINYSLDNPIGICHFFKNNTNWIFIVYFVKYIDGEIKIMEPDKCQGYRFFKYDELMNSNLVTESCKYISKNIKEII